MKLLQKLSFAVLVLLVFSCANEEKQEPKRIMIIGDSITQDGSYVSFLEYFLRTAYPKQTWDIISIGLSSETVNGASEPEHPFPRPCIHTRIDSALALIQPQIVLSCYGMNDGIFSEFDTSRFDAYKKGVNALQNKIEAEGAELILLTPTVFDPDPIQHRVSKKGEPHAYKFPYEGYNNVLTVFSDWLLNEKSKELQVIDLHYPLQRILTEIKKENPDTTFVPDGVHPNRAGHFLMAKEILKALHPEIEVPEPYPFLNEKKNDPLFVKVFEQRKIRSKGWLEYVGYDRGKVVKSDDIQPTKEQVQKLDKEIELLLNQPN